MSHLMNTYNRLPVTFSHGQGCWLWDENGKKYLDALAGIAVNTLGHNHPRLVAALQEQITQLIHTSNLYGVRLQEQLADQLVALSNMENVFFCNSGLEANEAAIKIARKYGHDHGISHPEIIVYEKAFHGRSLATLSATGNEKVQKGFEPLVEGFVRIPLNDMTALDQVVQNHPNVVAVFLEAIQGEGGINLARTEYLQAVRSVCDKQGWLLMIDEVQCGIGRTGKWFAHQWANIKPDVMPLAKGLASGIPIGAVVAAGAAAHVFQPGNHGTTFGGNPLACRAALETLQTLKDEDLLNHATQLGEHIRHSLLNQLEGTKGVVQIRGQGLMMGLELDRPCAELVKQALSEGFLINVTQERVIRLLPALIMNQQEADELIHRLVPLVKMFLQQPT